MTVRRYLGSLVVVAFAGVLSACGSSSDSDAGAGSDDGSTTSATAAPAKKGEPISEPVCDFIGISADDASGILSTKVTATSAVGDKDPSGGNCQFTPPTGDDDAVAVAVFPDTEENFDVLHPRVHGGDGPVRSATVDRARRRFPASATWRTRSSRRMAATTTSGSLPTATACW